jgi:hypothetical protein
MSEDELAAERRAKRMDRIDRMPPELRALVHEYGLTVVDAFTSCGVTKPKQIRHLIEVVRGGSYEIGKRDTQNQMANGWSKPVQP